MLIRLYNFSAAANSMCWCSLHKRIWWLIALRWAQSEISYLCVCAASHIKSYKIVPYALCKCFMRLPQENERGKHYNQWIVRNNRSIYLLLPSFIAVYSNIYIYMYIYMLSLLFSWLKIIILYLARFAQFVALAPMHLVARTSNRFCHPSYYWQSALGAVVSYCCCCCDGGDGDHHVCGELELFSWSKL